MSPLAARKPRQAAAAAPRRCGLRVLRAALATLLLPSVSASALQSEGPLANSSFQPVASEAWELLQRGDALLGPESADQGGRGRGFDSWQQALAGTRPGAAVPADGLLPEEVASRCVVGVEEAVLRRLEALEAEDRTAFVRRFEPLAAGSDWGSTVERLYPGTRAAAGAALEEGDLASERGRLEEARTWWERSARHARIGGHAASGDAARRRLGWLDEGTEAAPDVLAGATSLTLDSSHPVEGFRVRRESLRRVPLGRGMRLGAASLADGRLFVQGPRRGQLYDEAALSSNARPRTVDLEALVDRAFRELSPFAAPMAGGWSLLPASSPAVDRVLAIVDRGEPGRSLGSVTSPARGNRLMALAPEAGPESDLAVRWAREGALLTGPDASGVPLAGAPEFQPGPLLLQDRVLVTARLLDDAPADEEMPRTLEGAAGDLWLLALDAQSGRVLWSRFLTRASDLASATARRLRTTVLRSVGMPLGLSHDRVVTCTNTGIVTSHEVDGRLVWSLRTRRRGPDEPGWPGSRRPIATQAGIWVAPGDSDHAYLLDPRPGRPPLVREPVPLGSVQDLVGATSERLLLLGRDGPRIGLLQVEAGGRVSPVLHLAAGERFSGTSLLTASRLAVATDRRLYLFDVEGDVRLLGVTSLPEEIMGGDLVQVGARVLLLGVDRATRLGLRRD